LAGLGLADRRVPRRRRAAHLRLGGGRRRRRRYFRAPVDPATTAPHGHLHDPESRRV